MQKQQTLQQIISGYRSTISSRYQYKSIKEKYDIPASITEETVDKLSHYFLTYIYLEFEKRE